MGPKILALVLVEEMISVARQLQSPNRLLTEMQFVTLTNFVSMKSTVMEKLRKRIVTYNDISRQRD